MQVWTTEGECGGLVPPFIPTDPARFMGKLASQTGNSVSNNGQSLTRSASLRQAPLLNTPGYPHRSMQRTAGTISLPADTGGQETSGPTVLSVERALKILNCVAGEPHGLGTRDIARRLGYNPGTTQKILNTLRAQDYLAARAGSTNYRLGPAVSRLANLAGAHFDLASEAMPVLTELAARTGESALIGVRSGNACMYVAKVLSAQAVRMDIPVNELRPLNATAIGKVLLAFDDGLDWRRLHDLEADGCFEASTENSVTDPDALLAQLQKVVRDGVAYDLREYVEDGVCLAAPIFGPGSKILASISLSGPGRRVESRLGELRQELLIAANALTVALGGESPPGSGGPPAPLPRAKR